MREKDVWVDIACEVLECGDNDVKHILSVLDIKKMIPIKDGVYSIVELGINMKDNSKSKRYKNLANKEYRFCLKIIGSVITKANRLYDKQMSTGKVKKYCCDFGLLEKVCDEFQIED